MQKLPFIGAVAAAVFAVAPLPAQTYPAKSIQMIVPVQAGSGADSILRIVANKMAENMKQQIVLEKRALGVVELKVFNRPWFLISHPDDIESVLVKHARIMLRDEYVVVLERALGKGLLTSDGDLWKRQRKLMSQAFVPRRIKSYGDAMVAVTERALGPWRDGEVVNLHEEISRITMQVAASVLFGEGISEADVLAVREAPRCSNGSPRCRCRPAPRP